MGGPLQETRDARWAERYEFVANQRTLGLDDYQLVKVTGEKFGVGKVAARTLVRECLASYVSASLETVEVNREAEIRRTLHSMRAMLTVMTTAMRDGKPDYHARVSAARARNAEAKFLAELQGTLRPTEVKVTVNDQRENIIKGLSGLSDEEIVEWLATGKEPQHGRGEGQGGITH